MQLNSASTTIYAVDYYNYREESFSATGIYLDQWGSQGSGNGNLSNPYGVAINNAGTTVYVADSGNNRIVEFAP